MKNLKLLLIALFTTSFWFANASHIIGGDITYAYVGNQTGVANQYEITIILYREFTGAGITSPLLNDVNIQDIRIDGVNCGFSQQLQMHRIMPEFQDPVAFDCITQQTGLPNPYVNIFKDTIVLNTPCNQFNIWLRGCCRPAYGAASNIVSTGDFYFEAQLDRRLGNNTAPSFLNNPVNYTCANAYQIYQQLAVEPDGDSLIYELINPRLTATNNLIYQANYDYLNPISCDLQFPFTLDPQTGTLTFMANTGPQISTFAIQVREFRFDSLYGYWEQVGIATREIQLVVTTTCRQEVLAGVKLDPTYPGTYIDQATGHQVRDYNCADTSVTLAFTIPVECYSVAADGTDFRLTAPNGQPIPIKNSTPFCNNNLESDSVRLSLFKPLIFNGDYIMYSKFGTDGNTLLNKCGKAMNEFDTIILRVTGCTDPVYDLKNVTVTNDNHNFIQWNLDSTTLDYQYVDFLRIQRSDDNGATFTQVGTAGIRDSGFHDYGVNPASVDLQNYKYRIEIVANGLPLDLTRSIQSIHLQGTYNSSTEQVPMDWTTYNGWANPEFNVELGVPGSNPGEYIWSPVSDPVSLPTSDSSYIFNAANLQPGNYALRVLTSPSADGYVSESNWVVFGIPQDPDIVDPDVALEIPNVFSPGPDLANPRWTISGVDSYDHVSVTIYDRWGHKVYSSANYSNSSAWDGTLPSGRDAAEGTYFFVLNATGGPNNSTVQEQGSITLFREK